MSNVTIRGIARDVTEHIYFPELFEKFGAGTRVYETHLFLEPHISTHIELWLLECRIVPSRSVFGWDAVSHLGRVERRLNMDTPRHRDMSKPLTQFTSLISTLDKFYDEGREYDEWYVNTMEREIEKASSEDVAGHIVAEYESWARTQNK